MPPPLAINADEDKVEPKMKVGIWLDVIERMEEYVIGIAEGIVKRRAIKRKPKEHQCNGAQILAAKGSTNQFVP